MFHGEELDAENRPLLIPSLIVPESGTFDAEFGGKEERALLERSLLRKLDRRMSILVLIYILNYIDRNNAAAARLRGFEEDLRLEGNQFASVLSALYIGYIIMQVPSNMFLHYGGKPSIYLPACMVVWGGISILTGFTTNFFGAVSTRFFLGFVEASFFPGALLLISRWYKRNELSQRTALLYCGSLISNAFGSLFASAILDVMDGIWGFAAWRWLFFVEGALTIFVAIGATLVLPDFPESNATWLTRAERALARRRMIDDAAMDSDEVEVTDASSTKNSYLSGLVMALEDWKVWWLFFATGSMTLSTSFNVFFPTLSATMGYSRTVTLLLCAPPWVFATAAAFLGSRHSDQSEERCWHIVIPFVIGISGFLLAMSTMSITARYFSLFLMAQSYTGYVCFLAWASGSISRPSSKRAVALAIINCGSTIGNIAGSYIWPSSWGPSYANSYAICIVASTVCIGMCFAFRHHLRLLNMDAERKEVHRRQMRKGYRYLL